MVWTEDCGCEQCFIKVEGQLLDETADSIEPLPTWKFHTTLRDKRRLLTTGVRLSDVMNHLTVHLPELVCHPSPHLDASYLPA